jgi:hypothetical protein
MPYGKLILDKTNPEKRPRILFDNGYFAGTLTEVTGFYVFLKNEEEVYATGVNFVNSQWYLIVRNDRIPIIDGMRVKK